jgi:very-short-patch-repair endonuclease
MDASPLKDRIAELAARQHGVAARSQLMELGMSSSAIGRALQAGRFRAIHRGVYLIGPLAPERAPEMAAVLAGGRGAALSHTTGGWLLGILRIDRPRPTHVTTLARTRRRRDDLVLHFTSSLSDDERMVIDGIPVTAPGRTIVDVSGMLGYREVERVVGSAERQGLIGSEELAALPDRYAGREGMAMLRAVIGDAAALDLTRSEAERRCLQLLRAAGFPRPQTNVPAGIYELDIFWPDENVAIEVDGHAHHSSRPRFEGDREKDNWLRARGIQVIRLTWRQITRRPTATAARIGETLGFARAQRAMAREARERGTASRGSSE